MTPEARATNAVASWLRDATIDANLQRLLMLATRQEADALTALVAAVIRRAEFDVLEEAMRVARDVERQQDIDLGAANSGGAAEAERAIRALQAEAKEAGR